jgi:hypothetical protein
MKYPTCALYSTVFPQVGRFLPAWYESVDAQTDRSFDLWLGVDGMTRADVAECLGFEPEAHWVLPEPGDTGASIRRRAMERIVDRYDTIVFVDSDDVMLPQRVAESRRALELHDVVGCALRIIDEDGIDLDAVVEPGADWRPERLLPRYNVFGLSNTAYRTAVLRRCLPYPTDCVLVDWFLATRAWLDDADLWFDVVPQMLYRQYPRNTARAIPPFRARDVMQATQRVLGHYAFVLHDAGASSPHTATLHAARAEVAEFHRAMHDEPTRLDAYTQSLNALPPRYVWWWSVANPQLRHLWNN